MFDQVSRFDLLKEKIKDFPTSPGVYLMKSQVDKIIYVGKAKSLRNRVRSYFSDSPDHSPKTKILVRSIFEVEYIITKTEVEAFFVGSLAH
jgi:excinuclease ABC subunit C